MQAISSLGDVFNMDNCTVTVNANGMSTRFHNGLQICARVLSRALGEMAESGTVFFAPLIGPVPFPQPFIEEPVQSITAAVSSTAAIWVGSGGASTTNWPSYYVLSNMKRTDTSVRVRYLAVGKWK